MTDNELLDDACTALWGDGWRAKLAAELDVDLRVAQRWGSGRKPIGAFVWTRLSTLLAEHSTLASTLAKECAQAAATAPAPASTSMPSTSEED